MARNQILSALNRELPETINKLTPNGRIPSDVELTPADRLEAWESAVTKVESAAE